MRAPGITLVFAFAVLLAGSGLAPVRAAPCGNGGSGFKAWLSDFKREAVSRGIPAHAVKLGLSRVSYNPKVIRLDRGQHSFKLSFKQFYNRRVSKRMIARGRSYIGNYRRLFGRIESQFGVPAEVLVSIWGLETNFGGFSGNMSTMRSLATLAYDCRRSDFFTRELLAALRIIARGDMSPRQMRGAWAGELGQTQFLASNYVKYAVDYDGNGKRDLIHSIPDVMASTANYLRAKGWRKGQDWGPGTANYNVLRQWNKAGVYVKTISVMARKMSGR